MFEYLIYKEIILEEYGHALKTYLVEERHFVLMSVYQGSGNTLPWSSDRSPCLHIKSGFAHVTCFGQWNTSKHWASWGLICACTLELCLLLLLGTLFLPWEQVWISLLKDKRGHMKIPTPVWGLWHVSKARVSDLDNTAPDNKSIPAHYGIMRLLI